jgi:hypothetical protein
MPEFATDPLLALQLKLPTHTFSAVKRRADELDDNDRAVYLSSTLSEWERSEGKGE